MAEFSDTETNRACRTPWRMRCTVAFLFFVSELFEQGLSRSFGCVCEIDPACKLSTITLLLTLASCGWKLKSWEHFVQSNLHFIGNSFKVIFRQFANKNCHILTAESIHIAALFTNWRFCFIVLKRKNRQMDKTKQQPSTSRSNDEVVVKKEPVEVVIHERNENSFRWRQAVSEEEDEDTKPSQDELTALLPNHPFPVKVEIKQEPIAGDAEDHSATGTNEKKRSRPQSIRTINAQRKIISQKTSTRRRSHNRATFARTYSNTKVNLWNI